MREINEKNVKKFIRNYKFEYYLGKVIGEDKFSKMFGYLNPNVPFDKLTGEDLHFLIESYFKED